MIARNLADLSALFEHCLRIDLVEKKSRSRSARLYAACEYAMIAPAKRLRPLMVMAIAIMYHREKFPHHVLNLAMPGALAIEYVHTYSLIHDDLPAMDDDDVRRGRLSVHCQFDEALAILAGDALLAEAFINLAKLRNNAVAAVVELSSTLGLAGLCAGQAEDLVCNVREPEHWFAVNEAKTARLFEASAVIGALAVGASREEIDHARIFGRLFGHLFQIKDDIDDNNAKVSSTKQQQKCIELRSALNAAVNVMPQQKILFDLLEFL